MPTLIYIVILLLFLTLSSSCLALMIGAFNIQIFGASKSSKNHIMDILSQIVLRYDILLVQEIRDSKGTAIQKLVDSVNSLSSSVQYDYIVSERLGRTSQKEQYAFVYRKSSGISVLDSHTHNDGVVGTEQDLFEREPLMVHFSAQSAGVKSFVLVGIHIKPDDAVQEINQLDKIFAEAETHFGTTSIMIMGDMNADCSYVGKRAWSNIPIKHDPDVHWLIGDEIDTTVGATDCAYDRILLKGNQFKDEVLEGSARIFNFQTEYKLNDTFALEVSDHFPVELQLKNDPTSGVSGWKEGSVALVTATVIGGLYKIWYH